MFDLLLKEYGEFTIPPIVASTTDEAAARQKWLEQLIVQANIELGN